MHCQLLLRMQIPELQFVPVILLHYPAVGAATYTWDNGVVNGVAFTPAGTQTYTVTGTDANTCQNTAAVTITVTACVPMVAGFSYTDNICIGDCITFTDTTTGNTYFMELGFWRWFYPKYIN